MTPEQLREWADVYDAGEVQPGVSKPNRAEAYRLLAAALEELARLRTNLEIDAVQYDALLAERDRERKEHAQWVRDHQTDTDSAHRAKQRAESALADAGRKGWEDGMRKAAGILEARDARAYKHIKEYAEDNNATFDDNKYLLGRGDEAHGAYRAILAAIGEGK